MEGGGEPLTRFVCRRVSGSRWSWGEVAGFEFQPG